MPPFRKQSDYYVIIQNKAADRRNTCEKELHETGQRAAGWPPLP